MSDYETGDAGYDGGDGAEYGHFEAGQEHSDLDQLHQAAGSEHDASSQFGVYEADHASAESTEFQQGHHVEYDNPGGSHYESTDYTNYDHDQAESDHIFAAEGSEQSHSAEFSELDALRERLDTAFESGTVLETGGDHAAELGPAS